MLMNGYNCRKKSGKQPTGVLLHRVKATGYSSVSDFLQVTAGTDFCFVKSGKDMDTSLDKQATTKKVHCVITVMNRK